MSLKKHLLMINLISVIITFYSMPTRASTSINQNTVFLQSTNESIEASVQQNLSSGTGKINGKVTDTSGLPLSGITISIQLLTEETIYGSSFENMATTNEKGKFKIKGLTPGKYVIRATPTSDEFYLPNDVFNVTVKTKKTTEVKIKLSPASPSGAEFVGSAVCLGCHPDRNGWKDTAHANTINTPTSKTVVAPFHGDIITTNDGKVKFKPFIENDAYKVTLYDLTNETSSVIYTIARTLGGVAFAFPGKQVFQVKIGNSHYLLPIQYNNKNVDESDPDASWTSYYAHNWYNSNGTLIATDGSTPPNKNMSFEQSCEGCHATGLSISRNAEGEFVSGSNELRIACERCHGPGSLHVSVGGGNQFIVNPKYLATDRGSEVCGQCHIFVKNKEGENGAAFGTIFPSIIDGEELIQYIPGKPLKNYITERNNEEIGWDGILSKPVWDDNDTITLGEDASENNHSKRVPRQYQDLTISRHYHTAGLKCYSCHEPHGFGVKNSPLLRQRSDNNKICITCHKKQKKNKRESGKRQNKHAKHLYSSSDAGGGRCTGCHMPRTAKFAVDNDIASHVIDIIKPHTSKVMADANTEVDKENNPGTVITNSCYGCHQEDTDYGVERWNKWEKED